MPQLLKLTKIWNFGCPCDLTILSEVSMFYTQTAITLFPYVRKCIHTLCSAYYKLRRKFDNPCVSWNWAKLKILGPVRLNDPPHIKVILDWKLCKVHIMNWQNGNKSECLVSCIKLISLISHSFPLALIRQRVANSNSKNNMFGSSQQWVAISQNYNYTYGTYRNLT